MKFRLFLCCSFFLCTFVQVIAQTAPGAVEPVSYVGTPDLNRIKPSPASDYLKSLFKKTFDTQKSLTDAQERASSMFDLLNLQIPTSDNVGAEKTVDALIDTCGAVSNPFAQDELLGKTAFASNQLGNFEQAVKLVKGISDSSLRVRLTLGIIEQRIDLDKANAEKDNTPVDPEKALERYLPSLRELLGFAIRDKNNAARSSACTLMGILLARADEIDEANQFFDNAVVAASELEKIDAVNAIAFILQKQAITLMESGNERIALDVSESQPTQERKNNILGGIVFHYLHGKTKNIEQAISIFEEIKEIPDNAMGEEFRNSVLAGIVTAVGETQDADSMKKLIELNINSPITKERAVAAAINAFLQSKKSDQALKMLEIKNSLEFKDSELSKIISWDLRNQNTDQAIESLKLVAKEERRKALSRTIVQSMILAGKDEEARKFLDSFYTESEKRAVGELGNEYESLAAETDSNLNSVTNLFARQLQAFDIFGARKTLLIMADAAERITNPASEIDTLFTTGKGLIQLGAKEDGKKVLAKIESKIDELLTTDQRLAYLDQLVTVLVQMDEKGDAKRAIDRIIELAPSKTLKTDQIFVMIKAIMVLQQLGDKDGAVKTMHAAEKIADTLDKPQEKCGAYLTFGRILLQVEAE